MSATEIDAIVSYSLLAIVLFVCWPAAVLYARRCNRKSEEGRRELEAKVRAWIDQQ